MELKEVSEKGGFWEPDNRPNNTKKLTNLVVRDLGLTKDNIQKVATIEELRENPPNIVIAQAQRSYRFVQNYFKEQWLKKKTKYILGLGVFQQLQMDPSGKRKLLKPTGPKFKNLYRPYIGQDDIDGETLLIFRTGGIGDLLFIQPNLRYLKEKHPDCRIEFACGPQYQPMVEAWDCVDEVLDLPFPLSKLQKAKYHVLFEGVIERCEEAEDSNAYNLFSRWMGLDLPDELLVPKQTPQPELVDKCTEILGEWGLPEKSFIVMQLRASSPIRCPKPDFWLDMINKLTARGHHIVLTDNPRQGDKVDQFIRKVYKKDMVHNFCSKSDSIAHSIALISLAEGVIATDSAMNHIAVSVDVPAFGLMGPFPGYVRYKTYKKVDYINAKRHCAPCFLHGVNPCKEAAGDGFSPCYENIDTGEVVDRYEALIERCK